MAVFDAARLRRPLRPLRRARARHGRGDERHGAARRRDPLRRHLHGVLRLQPPRDPPGRPDGHAGDPRDDPRLDRPRRGRPDPPAGRASGLACGRCPTSTSSARPTRWRPPSAGSWRWTPKTTPSVMALSRQKTAGVRGDAGENLSARGAYQLAAAGQPRPGDDLRHRHGGSARAGRPRPCLRPKASATRVVSVPCFELFEAQPADYQAKPDRRDRGPRRRRGRRPPGLGPLHRRGRRLRRHDRLRRHAPRPRRSTSTSASPPRPSARRRRRSCSKSPLPRHDVAGERVRERGGSDSKGPPLVQPVSTRSVCR